MPTIASFYGIIIMMHLRDKEHEPPHIHVFYGDDNATFEIESGNILWGGKFPKTGTKLVRKFISLYKKELLEMWNTGIYYSLPPIK